MTTARVGFYGLGMMGAPMARNIGVAGLLAGVGNRTRSTAERVAADLGVPAFATPAELARASDVVVTMVSDAAAIEALADGPDGVLAGLRPGSVWVDMSTTGPAGLEALSTRLAAIECELVDAPVSGSVAVAERAALTIMAGGSPAAFERVQPVLATMGANVLHLGPLGAGATMKLSVNSLIFAINEAVAESLVLAERAGISRTAAYDVFEASAADSPVVRYRRPQFESPDDAPTTFRLVLAAKDLDLILGLARSVGAAMPQAERTAEIVRGAIAAGRGEQDLALVAAYLRGLDRDLDAS